MCGVWRISHWSQSFGHPPAFASPHRLRDRMEFMIYFYWNNKMRVSEFGNENSYGNFLPPYNHRPPPGHSRQHVHFAYLYTAFSLKWPRIHVDLKKQLTDSSFRSIARSMYEATERERQRESVVVVNQLPGDIDNNNYFHCHLLHGTKWSWI